MAARTGGHGNSISIVTICSPYDFGRQDPMPEGLFPDDRARSLRGDDADMLDHPFPRRFADGGGADGQGPDPPHARHADTEADAPTRPARHDAPVRPDAPRPPRPASRPDRAHPGVAPE